MNETAINETVINETGTKKPEAKEIAIKVLFTILFTVEMAALLFAGGFVGQFVGLFFSKVMPESDFSYTFIMYICTLGAWIVMMLYLVIFKKNRPMLAAVGTKAKGNKIKYTLLGILFGFGMNMSCAIVAFANKDIHITFDRFNPILVLMLLAAVYIQSSSEELLCRAIFYQRLKKLYNSPMVAVIANAILFASLHLMNPGITVLAYLNIALVGILFSLVVYYFDSLWMAFGIHAGWNFTQSILLGLPNSGLCVPYSVFKLDTANARDSFAYSVGFGLEGTITACVLTVACCVMVVLIAKKRQEKNVVADAK